MFEGPKIQSMHGIISPMTYFNDNVVLYITNSMCWLHRKVKRGYVSWQDNLTPAHYWMHDCIQD